MRVSGSPFRTREGVRGCEPGSVRSAKEVWNISPRRPGSKPAEIHDHAYLAGMTMLHSRWHSLWQTLHAPTAPEDTLEELLGAYGSPGRFYHNLEHIHDCLSLFDHHASLAEHPEEVELAIWFHDAVYDTTRSDNEKKSAEWVAECGVRSVGCGVWGAECGVRKSVTDITEVPFECQRCSTCGGIFAPRTPHSALRTGAPGAIQIAARKSVRFSSDARPNFFRRR